MRRWSKILVLGACGVVVVVAVCFFCLRESEPSYNGRTFSEWVVRFGEIKGADSVAMEQRYEAAKAVRAIGTNGVPILLHKLTKSRREYGYEQGFKRFPHFLRPVAERITGRWDNDTAFVMMGFSILGTNAACALPELARQFSTGNDIAVSSYAIEAIGVPGFDFYLSVIESGGKTLQRRVAIRGVGRMRDLGTNSLRAVPVLIKVATNRSDIFSGASVSALADLQLAPEQVLPVFTNKLASTNVHERLNAIEALYEFGTNAKPAISAIKSARFDSDPESRQDAINTLRKIEAQINSAPAKN